jgi:hypothetical protein
VGKTLKTVLRKTLKTVLRKTLKTVVGKTLKTVVGKTVVGKTVLAKTPLAFVDDHLLLLWSMASACASCARKFAGRAIPGTRGPPRTRRSVISKIA